MVVESWEYDQQGSICETRKGPNRPKTRMSMGCCRFKIYILWKPLFLANLTTSGRVFFMTEMVKKHIYGPRPFICSKVLARTSSSLEKPLFWAILANLTTSGGVFLTEMVKRHIYGPRPFIWAYNQVSMTFRSKVLARTRKRWQTDGRTDRRTDGQTDGRTPQLYRPPTLGLGPKKF